MSAARKYALPIVLGFVGMIVSHIIVLLGFGAGAHFPIYLVAYPIVCSVTALILSQSNPRRWLSNAALVCAIPFLYWYVLLWSDGKMHVEAALNIRESSGMLLIMPLSFGRACFAAFIVSTYKMQSSPESNNGT
jgi:hypothetical protein